VRTCFPDGREEWVFLDGLVVKTDPNLDERILLLPNGQREVHHKGEMVRYSVLLYVMFALSNGIFNETSHEAAGKQDSVRKALVSFSTLAYFDNCQASISTRSDVITTLTALKSHKSQKDFLLDNRCSIPTQRFDNRFEPFIFKYF
jgi:hypothetical protein